MRTCFAWLLLALPMVAHAAPSSEEQFWRDCKTDEECVLVKGVCGPTAVHQVYKDEAAAALKKRAATAKCANQFWVPQANAVRCRFDACEAVVN